MTRLCITGWALAPHAVVRLDGGLHHYLAHVLRLGPDAPLELFTGDGLVWDGRVVAVTRNETQVRLGTPRPGVPPSPVAIVLVQAILRPARLELVLEKATELGVHTVALVTTAHVPPALAVGVARRAARLQSIVREAAEQCGRAELPCLLGPLPLDVALEQVGGSPGFVLHEAAAASCPLTAALAALPTAAPPRLLLVSGPEGGFAPADIATCAARGVAPVRLGPRILRAETAPLAALAVVQAAVGDWGALT